MLPLLNLALINVFRELDEAEMRELIPTLERSAGPPEEVKRLRELVQCLRGYLRTIGEGLSA